MSRPAVHSLCWLLLIAACGSGDFPHSQELERARSRGSSADREWRTYLGDRAASHHSPLDQIHPGNVAQLVPAWSYETGDLQSGAVASQIQFNPLVVKGVLYGASPTKRLFALDASTGALLWSFEPPDRGNPFSSTRGAVYWEEGDDERILFGCGQHLYAVDARTGKRIAEFGDDGRIDLREGLGRDVSGDFMGVEATTPAALFEDLLIIGGRVNEIDGAAPGHVRAYDVRTGEMKWIFHTIPQPGEFGYETWPADAWERSGGANAWAGISVDAERGLAFVPTGSAAFDFNGADREGDNLFANTLVALDARTGERRWHYQTIRHDVWDRDLPAPPNLVEIERNGERIPAVAQVTKTGDTFVLHRETGESLFEVREVPVVGPGVPGEFLASSQPAPLRPPPFVRQGFFADSASDISAESRANVASQIASLRYGAMYAPPSTEGTVQYPGLDGGAEWGGAAWDADTGLLFVNANQVPWVVRIVEAPEGTQMESLEGGYLALCSACHGLDMAGDGATVPSLVDISDRMSFFDIYRTVRDGRGRMPALGGTLVWWQNAALSAYVYTADPEDTPAAWSGIGSGHYLNAGYQKLTDLDQLPGSKPPWGNLTAIDLSAGEIRWQIPLGDYPRALELGYSGLGAENYGGPVVTAGGLLFIAATPDAMIRAFDKRTGELLWRAELPAAGFATPVTYEADGRQFLVVAAGGGKLDTPSGSRYVAFSLPSR